MNTSIKYRSWQDSATNRPTWQIRALAVVAALVVNAVILAVARLVNGEFPIATVGSTDETIGFAQVLLLTAMSGLVAWGLLTVLERTTTRALRIWTIIAFVMLALSMLGPIGSAVNTSSIVVLTLLHLGAAATIIPLLRMSAQGRE